VLRTEARGAFHIATYGVHPGVAYLVECRTSSLHAALRAPWLVMQVLDSLKRSQVLRDPDVVLDPDTRSLLMTARIETARTPQLAAVMASNELLWRTNQYCGDDPGRHVKITHLVSQLAAS
jgi:hypothetical protein